MSALIVKRPPSKKRWNETMFTVIGKIRIEASAMRFVAIRTRLMAKTTAMSCIMYPLMKSALIKANASVDLYKSAVGAGKIPRAPSIGVTTRSPKIILSTMCSIFKILY